VFTRRRLEELIKQWLDENCGNDHYYGAMEIQIQGGKITLIKRYKTDKGDNGDIE